MIRPDLYETFRHLGDEEWRSVLERSAGEQICNGVALPGFPPDSLQVQFVGSANSHAVREGFNFFSLIKAYSEALGWPMSSDRRVLDFGVGWGRIIRAFAKDVKPENLFGVDVDPDILEMCESLGIPGTLQRIFPDGVLPFPDDSFDVVYAFSVFSHLPENIQLRWLKEIARVLKPGGVFACTVEHRRFLETLADPEACANSDWLKGVANVAGDTNRLLREFDEGQFVYIPSGGGAHRSADVYGDAAIPLPYINSVWSKFFHVRAYRNDTSFWQAVVVCQADTPEGLAKSAV